MDFVFAGHGKVQKKYIQSLFLIHLYDTYDVYVKWRMEHGSEEDPFTDSLIDEVYRYSSLSGKIAERPHMMLFMHMNGLPPYGRY